MEVPLPHQAFEQRVVRLGVRMPNRHRHRHPGGLEDDWGYPHLGKLQFLYFFVMSVSTTTTFLGGFTEVGLVQLWIPRDFRDEPSLKEQKIIKLSTPKAQHPAGPSWMKTYNFLHVHLRTDFPIHELWSSPRYWYNPRHIPGYNHQPTGVLISALGCAVASDGRICSVAARYGPV
jgi:hypothetical protein